MSQTLTIARRELASLFYSPIAYVVLGLFSFLVTLAFCLGFFYPGAPATLRELNFWVVWILVLVVPAISMRMLSEELRTGAVELLMTAPIDDGQVVVGKWLGAMGFFLVLLAPLVVFAIVLAATGRPDYGPIIGGLLGLVLAGAFFLAIGAFASAATQNQIIAFVLAVAVMSVFTFVTYFLPMAQWVQDNVRQVLFYLNVVHQLESFNKGLIDWPNLVFFVSGTAFFLFLAAQLLQSKRWR